MSNYPSTTLPAGQRTPQWIADYLRAFLAEARAKGTHYAHFKYPSDSRLNIDVLRAYARGQQNAAHYGRYKLGTPEAQALATRALNVPQDIIAVIPHFLGVLTGRVSNLSCIAQVTAYHHLPDGTPSPRQQLHDAATTALQHRDFLQQVGMGVRDIVPQLPEEPTDPDHLAWMLDEVVTDEMAAMLQRHVNEGLTKSQIKQLLRQFVRELVTVAGGAFYNPPDGPLLTRFIAPEFFVALPSRDEYFTDARALGHYDEVTIGELKRMAAKGKAVQAPMNEEQWRALAGQYGYIQSETLSPSALSNGPMPYDEQKVRIFIGFFRCDEPYLQERRYGGQVVFDRNDTPEQRRKYDLLNGLAAPIDAAEQAKLTEWKRRGTEMLLAEPKTMYTGILIPDTPYAFACRKSPNQLRDPLHPKEVLFPYAPVLLNGGVSRLMQALPYADEAQRQWMRMQEDLAGVAPAGYSLDKASLKTLLVSGKTDGSNVTEKDIMATFLRVGWQTFDSDPDPNAPDDQKHVRPAAPIQPQFHPLPPSVLERLNLIQQNINHVARIFGTNDVSAGLQVKERQGKATAELAMAATDMAISDLYAAAQNVMEAVCYRLMLKDAAMLGVTNAYAAAVDVGANEQEWQELYAYANNAIAAGKLHYSDLLFLKRTRDLAQAQRYVAFREKQEEARLQQNQQATFAGQTQAAQAAEQAKQQTVQLKMQLQRELDHEKHEAAYALEELRQFSETERVRMQTGQRADAAAQQADNQLAAHVLAHAQHEDQMEAEEEAREMEQQQMARQAAAPSANPA